MINPYLVSEPVSESSELTEALRRIAELRGLLQEVLDTDSSEVKETELGDRIRARLENNRGEK